MFEEVPGVLPGVLWVFEMLLDVYKLDSEMFQTLWVSLRMFFRFLKTYFNECLSWNSVFEEVQFMSQEGPIVLQKVLSFRF